MGGCTRQCDRREPTSCARFEGPPVAKSLCYARRETQIDTHDECAFVGCIVLPELRSDCAGIHF
jgi:hypothetical protein